MRISIDRVPLAARHGAAGPSFRDGARHAQSARMAGRNAQQYRAGRRCRRKGSGPRASPSFPRVGLPRSGGGVQAAFAQLRLAEGLEIPVRLVVFQNVESLQAGADGLRELVGPHEIEIVGGCMVFRKGPMHRAHEASDRQVEAGRAELPLVVAVRRERLQLSGRVRMPQDVREGAVDGRVVPPGPLKGERRIVADAGQYEPVPDALQHGRGCATARRSSRWCRG